MTLPFAGSAARAGVITVPLTVVVYVVGVGSPPPPPGGGQAANSAATVRNGSSFRYNRNLCVNFVGG